MLFIQPLFHSEMLCCCVAHSASDFICKTEYDQYLLQGHMQNNFVHRLNNK